MCVLSRSVHYLKEYWPGAVGVKLRIKFSVFITTSTMWKNNQRSKKLEFLLNILKLQPHTSSVLRHWRLMSAWTEVTLRPTLSEDNKGKWRQRARRNRKKQNPNTVVCHRTNVQSVARSYLAGKMSPFQIIGLNGCVVAVVSSRGSVSWKQQVWLSLS